MRKYPVSIVVLEIFGSRSVALTGLSLFNETCP